MGGGGGLCRLDIPWFLLLSTSLQLADTEQREGWRPHQTSAHGTFPWTPAKTRRQQLATFSFALPFPLLSQTAFP